MNTETNPNLKGYGPVIETVEVAKPTPHHRYGPSSLKNREICPGWENDQSADKTAANEGTLMHLAFEKRKLDILPLQEQREQVQKCIGFVARYEKAAKEIHHEVRLSILDGLTFGTADEVIILSDTHAMVFDAKFGRAAVDDADQNRQGFSYTVGVFERWPKLETVEVVFAMPRRDEITRHTFSRKADFNRIALTIKAIIGRAKIYAETQDASMLNMTEENCVYCKKLHCPKMMSYGLDHARRYAPLEIADEVHSSQITDPAKMSQLYTAVRIMEKLVDSAKKHVQDFARENELPGYELRERAGATKITNSQLAHPVLAEMLTPEELVSIAEYSYSEALKLVSAKAPRGKKTEAAQKLFTALLDREAVAISPGITYLQRKKETVVEVASEVLPSVTE